MRKRLVLTGVIGVLALLSTPIGASPPPTHLADQTIEGLKFTNMYLFPFHTALNCDVADSAHVGGHAEITLDYYYPAGARRPYAHFSHSVSLPPTRSVDCGWGHPSATSNHVDHIVISVTRGGLTGSNSIHIGW